VSRQPVEFTSEGTTVRGWLYEPDQPVPPHAGLVMIHGFSATSTGMVADQYAEAFVEAGAVVLLFDPRGIGRSDGKSQVIDQWRQARDYLSGVAFLQNTHRLGPEGRIGVWGDSMSGQVALVVSAIDRRVAAVVVQVPALGDESESVEESRSRFESIRQTLLSVNLDKFDSTIEGPLPVVSSDQVGTPSLLTPLTAFHWFINYGARYGTKWQNTASVATPDAPIPAFSAQPCMSQIHVPLFMVVAKEDEMPGANSNVARHCFDLVPGPKELLEVDGGHFGLLYHDSEEFRISAQAQSDFVSRHLVGPISV
jgi:pimeloyl-ACP methyl ester carboxylesterase